MSRTEKAGEPSMEEILASIRKIIAEDPVAPKPAVEPSIAALAAFKPAAKPDTASSVASLSAIPVEAPRTASARIEPSWPSSSMSQNQPSASTSPAPAKSGPPAAAGMVAATSLDDVLGLADDSPPIASFGPSLSVSPSLQASIAAGALPLTEPRRSSLSPERAPVQPFFPPQTRDALAGVTQSRSASPETGLASFGAVVPNRADSRAFGATSDNSKLELSSRHPDLTVGGPRMERIPPNDWATANPQRATSELRSDAEPAPRIEAKIDAKPGDALSPGSAGAALRASSIPTGHAASPAAISKSQASDPFPAMATPSPVGSSMKSDDIVTEIAPVMPEPVLRAQTFGIDGQMPAMPASIAAPPKADLTKIELPKVELPKVELPKIETLQAEASKTASAIQALAGVASAGAASGSGASMNGAAKPDAAVTSAPSAPVPAAKPAAMDPTPGAPSKPNGVVTPSPASSAAAIPSVVISPVPVPPTNSASPMAADEPTRTMEDTVAELLRPMLRQWLDANMPRVVEKALRVELAASVKPKQDPPKH